MYSGKVAGSLMRTEDASAQGSWMRFRGYYRDIAPTPSHGITKTKMVTCPQKFCGQFSFWDKSEVDSLGNNRAMGAEMKFCFHAQGDTFRLIPRTVQKISASSPISDNANRKLENAKVIVNEESTDTSLFVPVLVANSQPDQRSECEKLLPF